MRSICLLLLTVMLFAIDASAQRSRHSFIGTTRTHTPVPGAGSSLESRQTSPTLPGFNSNGNNNKTTSGCPGPTDIPYSENFDTVTAPAIPDCITVENTNGGNAWRTVLDTDFPASAPNLMRLDFEQDLITAANDWFFTRGLNLSGSNSYRLTFKYRNSDGTAYIEKLEVKYGSGANSASMTAGTLFTNTNIDFNNTWLEGGIDFTPSSSGVYYIGFHGFSDANQAFLAIDDIKVEITPACPSPIGVSISNITSTSADVNFTAGVGNNYLLEYGPHGFIPGVGATAGVGGTIILVPPGPPVSLTGLNTLDTFDVYVRQVCSAGTVYGPNSNLVWFRTPLANDEAPGAIAITVDAACTGNSFTNLGATQGVTEPFASCEGVTGYHTVWYKFVAPAGGAVRISSDFSGSGLGDSRLAVFAATDVNNYNTFTIQGCDNDNGVIAGSMSIVYLADLIPTNTYYIQVDGFDPSTTQGSFCLQVDALTTAMIAASASCGSSQGHSGLNPSYAGWISLVDNSSNLIANVKQTAGTATSVFANVNVNIGAVRQDATSLERYLDRNFRIDATGTTAANIQLFFLSAELTTLRGADAAATLPTLRVTRQTGPTCQPDFATANGINSELIQTGSGTTNGVSWINATTPGLSNFYIHSTRSPVVTNIFLQGPYSSVLARHKDVTPQWAAALNTFALNQPYNTAAFGNYAGTESVTAGFFTSDNTHTRDITDWILLELKDGSNNLVGRRAAFVREDGKIIGIDRDSSIAFPGVASGNYYVTIRHRNHLGISTQNLIPLSAKALGVTTNLTTDFDFRTQSDANIFGTAAAYKIIASNNVMIGGNVVASNVIANNKILYSTPGNEPGAILALLGITTNTTFGSAAVNVYHNADVNLDGRVLYSTPGNDPALILVVLGNTINQIAEQRR